MSKNRSPTGRVDAQAFTRHQSAAQGRYDCWDDQAWALMKVHLGTVVKIYTIRRINVFCGAACANKARDGKRRSNISFFVLLLPESDCGVDRAFRSPPYTRCLPDQPTSSLLMGSKVKYPMSSFTLLYSPDRSVAIFS